MKLHWLIYQNFRRLVSKVMGIAALNPSYRVCRSAVGLSVG